MAKDREINCNVSKLEEFPFTQKAPNYFEAFKYCQRMSDYFTFSTIALKASGLFKAKSANAFLFKSIPDL